MKRETRSAREGSILVVALMVVSLVFVLAVGVIQFSATTGSSSSVAIDRKNAFYLSESGLADAYGGLCVGKTGNIGTPEAPALIGDGVYWVEATELPDDRVELECTALYGRASVTLGLVTERITQTIEELGLYSVDGVELDANSYIDSYDSTAGTYAEQLSAGLNLDEATLSSSSDITVGRGTIVKGNLAHGIGASATVHPGAVVSGAVGEQASAPELPPVDPPTLAVAPDVTLLENETIVIPPGEYAIDDVQLAPGSDAVFTGPATLVLGQLTAQSNSTLTLDTRGGEVDLFVTGTIDMQSGSELVTVTEDPQDVTMQLGGLSSSLAATSVFYGQIYAPSCELTIANDFEVFGGVVAKDLVLGAGARLHMDIGDYESRESRLPRMLSWRVVDIPDAVAGSQFGPWATLGINRDDLLPPAESHEDQWLNVEYVALDGVNSTYDGLESGFDWSQVSDVVSATRDGEPVRDVPDDSPRGEEEPEEPAPVGSVSDLIADPGVSSSDLKNALNAESPVTSADLMAAIERIPEMDSSDLMDVLQNNHPLSPAVLMTAIETAPMTDGNLANVLLQNSPLANPAMMALLEKIPPMNAIDLATVLAAQ